VQFVSYYDENVHTGFTKSLLQQLSTQQQNYDFPDRLGKACGKNNAFQ
jgi:hypothetical protein